jgi:quinoprotein glucose dehydrogenase
VVQLTKMGYTFVLDRDTGEPLFPVHDLPVPSSNVPGEQTSPTQPVPLKPEPLVRQSITEADLTNITPDSRDFALREFRKYVAGPIYTPPTLQGTLTLPGHLGGSEWHGGSFDPHLNTLYVNVNEAATINKLRPVHALPDEDGPPAKLGRSIYDRTCVACHGTDRQGVQGLGPKLTGITRTPAELETVIRQGRNIMPGFRQFTARELKALLAFLGTAPGEIPADARPTARADRYTIESYTVFTDEHGVPAIAPPWGTLNAIDLVSGRILWKVPLGEYPQLVAKGIRNTGSMN